MVRRNLIHSRTKPKRTDERRTAPEAEPLKACHSTVGLIVDAAQKHRLKLANRHIVALEPRRTRIGKIVRNHVRVLGLCNHAGGRNIESSPHSILSLPQNKLVWLDFAVKIIFPAQKRLSELFLWHKAQTQPFAVEAVEKVECLAAAECDARHRIVCHDNRSACVMCDQFRHPTQKCAAAR